MWRGVFLLGGIAGAVAKPVVLPFRVRATPARDATNVVKKAMASWPQERLTHPDLLLAAHAFGSLSDTDDLCSQSLRRCKAYKNEPIYSALVEAQFARAVSCPEAEQCWSNRPIYSKLSGALSAREVTSGIRLLHMSGQSDKITDKAWVKYFSDWLDSMQVIRDIRQLTEAVQLTHSAFLVSKRNEDQLRFAMKLERLITHPIGTLNLIEGKELGAKAEFLLAAIAALNDVEPSFDQLYGLRLGISSLVTDSLSNLKPKATSVTTLSKLGGVLFTAEQNGLYSIVATKDASQVDFVLSTAGRRPASGVKVTLSPDAADSWTWSSESDRAWSASNTQEGVWSTPTLAVDTPHGSLTFDPNNLRAPLAGSCSGLLYHDNDGQWKELNPRARSGDVTTKLKGDDMLVWQQPCVTSEVDVEIRVCDVENDDCETRAALTAPLGFPFLALSRDTLKGFGSKILYVQSGDQSRSAEFMVMEPLMTAPRPSRIIDGADGIKKTSNDLEYTFHSEHPPTFWLGALAFTGLGLGTPLAAWEISRRLRVPVLPYVQKQQVFSTRRRLVIFAALCFYGVVMIRSLLQYWVSGKLIPYGTFLVPAGVVFLILSVFVGTEIDRGLKSV